MCNKYKMATGHVVEEVEEPFEDVTELFTKAMKWSLKKVMIMEKTTMK